MRAGSAVLRRTASVSAPSVAPPGAAGVHNVIHEALMNSLYRTFHARTQSAFAESTVAAPAIAAFAIASFAGVSSAVSAEAQP